MHRSIPVMVGRRMDTAVHFRLPVSLYMVRQVVEQGQWKRQKIIRQTGVTAVQPWAEKIEEREAMVPVSVSIPVWRYAISMMGSTISLAGNPNRKAARITPSSPIRCPSGSRAPVSRDRRLG